MLWNIDSFDDICRNMSCIRHIIPGVLILEVWTQLFEMVKLVFQGLRAIGTIVKHIQTAIHQSFSILSHSLTLIFPEYPQWTSTDMNMEFQHPY